MKRFVIDVVICSSKDDQLQHAERGATINTIVAFIEKPKKDRRRYVKLLGKDGS